jgi:hypothetical protein
MNRDSAAGATAVDDAPDWWPYAPEFPHWHVWRGVAGLLYARRPRTSPPKVVRGEDLTTLRKRIIDAELVRLPFGRARAGRLPLTGLRENGTIW